MIKFLKRVWNNLITDYVDQHQIFIIDTDDHAKYSLVDIIAEMRLRIEKLEHENIETSNCLYEIQNQLDMLSSCQYNMLDNPYIIDKDVRDSN
jgi:hypothetical protein